MGGECGDEWLARRKIVRQVLEAGAWSELQILEKPHHAQNFEDFTTTTASTRYSTQSLRRLTGIHERSLKIHITMSAPSARHW